MHLTLDPRIRRLLRRIPHTTVYSALELALLSVLALQCARLVWTVAAPVDPVGEWRAAGAMRPALPGSSALLGEFDPFFRLSGDAGPMVVTSLELKLFGVREDRATGRGSAIISTPDGQQRSFAVGEEIVPGVTLAAVGFDNVTISRSGTMEQLFLDQSPSAAIVSPGEAPIITMPSLDAGAAPPQSRPAPMGSIATDVTFQPRLNGAEVSGVVVQPQGSGDAFRAAGFAPGDVIVSVGGKRIRSADQARALAGQLSGEREVVVQVERDGRVIPLRVRAGQ